MSNEKVEFELGFVDSPDSGRQLAALAEQVEKTQQRMSASVKAFSSDMQNSVRDITTAASQATSGGGAGGSSGPSPVSIAKREAAETEKQNRLKLKNVEETGRKIYDMGRRGAEAAVSQAKQVTESVGRIWEEAVSSRSSAEQQLTSITEASGRRNEQSLRSQRERVNELRESFMGLAGTSVDAAAAMSRVGRGLALFSGSESQNMEKVLRTIMKIQGAMDLLQGARGVASGVRNNLMPAGSRFMTALGGSAFTESGRAARGFELAAARGVGGFAASAAGGAASNAAGGVASSGGRGIMNYAIGSALARGAMRYGGSAVAAGRGMLSSAGRVARAIPGRLGTMGARIGQALGPQTAGLVGGSPLAGSASSYIGGAAGNATSGRFPTLARYGGRAARAGGRLGGTALRMGARVGGTLASAPVAAGVAATFGLGAAAFGGFEQANSSSSEGGSAAGNFLNRKYTVGGVADKGGQQIAKMGDSINNMIGYVMGASRSFDLLGNKMDAHMARMAEQAKIVEQFNDAMRQTRRFAKTQENIADRSNDAQKSSFLVGMFGNTGGTGQLAASNAGMDMSRFRSTQAAGRNRRLMGSRERGFMRQREKENDFMIDRNRGLRMKRAEVATEATAEAKERYESAKAAVDGQGMSAAEMEQYNMLVEERNAQQADLQSLNAQYRAETGQNLTAAERSVTGEGAGPGSRRDGPGPGQAYRSYTFGMMTRETTHEENEMRYEADRTRSEMDATNAQIDDMDRKAGRRPGQGAGQGFSQDEIDQARNNQEELNAATEEYMQKRKEMDSVLQGSGRELIEHHRAVRAEIEKNIVALEREKIANDERSKASQRSMGTMGEADRANMMVAMRKLDSGQTGDMTNAEIESLKSSGMLNDESTARLEQEQEDRYRRNMSASDQAVFDRQTGSASENALLDQGIAQQDAAMAESNAQVEQDAEAMGLSDGGGTLKIVDGTNFQIQLQENMDALTSRAVDDIMEAMDTRNELLKDQIVEEVTARMQESSAAKRNARAERRS